MITQNIKKTALTLFLLISNLHAFELHNPLSECNQNQSETMKTKCDKLDSVKYSTCERKTLQEFVKCTQGVKNEK